MSSPRLEEVFKTNGVPTHTFVQPSEYDQLKVSLRTRGRGVVLEGPSGIGKTTAVERLLDELALGKSVTKLSARKVEDLEYIQNLPRLGKVGTVIIDDFHKLDDVAKEAIANYLKVLADDESIDVKLIVVGINRAGERLIRLASDLVNRIDVIRFESNPDSKVAELVSKGEAALNIKLNVADEIVSASQGSFYIGQLLAQAACVAATITEHCDDRVTTQISFEAVRAAVWDRLSARFDEACKIFCRGPRMRTDGRAPYLHLLKWLAGGREWTLSITDAVKRNPELSGSVGQIAEKGFLARFIAERQEIRDILHYDQSARQLTVEDPQFVFYLRNISWNKFAKELGFAGVTFDSKYDFALSFAGPDRAIAEGLYNRLVDEEVEVFYDKNEQHRILATDVEEYLRPIYQSEAAFVVCVLGPEYPKRVWTKVESDAFKERFKDGEVIPIWLDSAPPSAFDRSRAVGGIEFFTKESPEQQIERIVETLRKKLAEHRGQLHFSL
jgi:hypothetical protein